eukprot:TRINITY_DN1468_c0_g1_i2.p1 TRINITY_DN1468_c0_g1~~TRINITY_DN1468_c0_g1_i2.p1  ORF type:complete len:716 (-),score=154.68 TRINITY_DN1468_c0_g1_i2:772-2919(-)
MDERTPRTLSDTAATVQPWMRLQTSSQRASSFRIAGADVLRPQIDTPSKSPRAKKAVYSPRPPVNMQLDPLAATSRLGLTDSNYPHLILPRIDGEYRKETPRARTLEFTGAPFDHFKSHVIALEVKMKEYVESRITNDLPGRAPTIDFIQGICEALNDCSAVASPVQQTLSVVVPEAIKCIYNTKLPANEHVNVKHLNRYPPFILQVDYLELERQDLMEQVAKLENQVDTLVRDSADYQKKINQTISEMQATITKKDKLIEKQEGIIETLKQQYEAVKSEAEKYKTMYRNNLDHYEEDLAQAVHQEVEKYNIKLASMDQDRKSAIYKMNMMKETVENMKIEMETMIPIQTHEELKGQVTLLKYELNNARDQIEALKKTQSSLFYKAIHEMRKREKKVEANRMAYDDEISRRTPRPDWATLYPNDSKMDLRYVDIQAEPSTIGKVMLLREELSKLNDELDNYKAMSVVKLEKEKDPADTASSEKFFTGLGTGPEVPKYLRIGGKVKNRRLGKRETENIIKDIWKERNQAMKAGGNKKTRLPDFMYQYLLNHYGLHNVVVEWSYNLIDALERFKYDNDCEMFLRALQGEVSDDIQEDQATMLENFKQSCIKQDAVLNGKEVLKLPRKEMLALLGRFFSLKSPERLDIIRGALLQDQPTAMISYIKLFDEDREGNQGLFMEALRKQYLDEILEFNDSIEAALDQLEQSGPQKVEDLLR